MLFFHFLVTYTDIVFKSHNDLYNYILLYLSSFIPGLSIDSSGTQLQVIFDQTSPREHDSGCCSPHWHEQLSSDHVLPYIKWICHYILYLSTFKEYTWFRHCCFAWVSEQEHMHVSVLYSWVPMGQDCFSMWLQSQPHSTCSSTLMVAHSFSHLPVVMPHLGNKMVIFCLSMM